MAVDEIKLQQELGFNDPGRATDPYNGDLARISAEEDVWHRVDRMIIDADIWYLIQYVKEISTKLTEQDIGPQIAQLLRNFEDFSRNQQALDLLYHFYPAIETLIANRVIGIRRNIAQEQENRDRADRGDRTEEEWEMDRQMRLFTIPGQTPYTSALGFINTQQKLSEAFDKEFNRHIHANVSPETTFPWELRIGLCRFIVPPLNINVSQQYKVGSLTGGAIRQQTSPKFNSGHSETNISMTLYFPNQESIWGVVESGASISVGYTPETEIDFDNPDNDPQIDRFLSSLRGLIAQFKYAPFLPVRNEYLNKTHNITAVALQNMSVQTIPDYPFCVAVTLNMTKFNHKAYLPMIGDFNNAIHWGKFRQYMGRAAQKMASMVSKGFLVERHLTSKPSDIENESRIMRGLDVREGHELSATTVNYEVPEIQTFNPGREWIDGRNFDIYYPIRTPLKVFAPDASEWRQEGEDDNSNRRERAGWEAWLARFGINIDVDDTTLYDLDYDSVKQFATDASTPPNEREKVLRYLEHLGFTVEQMSTSLLQQFKDEEWAEYNRQQPQSNNASARAYIDTRSTRLWFSYMFNSYKQTPYFQGILRDAEFRDNKLLVAEWEVPMEKAPINWNKVLIQGVSVSMANNIVPIPLQMQAEPVHQHIGGRGTQISVAMRIFGEDEYIKIRRTFEHINGLARLEHAHGVLGFLGIKNVLTALCGVKYVLPLDIQVNTIPGFPRVYDVELSFVDFDVVQQRREELSTEQQRELIDAFGKRNPFLRIKQLWGSFNAYPDFPLSVKDPHGRILGHLDPDFYFKSFKTIDDDIVYKSLQRPADGPIRGSADSLERQVENAEPIDNRSLTLGSYDHTITHYFGISEDTKNVAVQIKDDGWHLSTVDSASGNMEYAETSLRLHDDLATLAHTSPAMPSAGTTPLAQYQHPHATASSDPNSQFHLMMVDSQYRDMAGRMVRAFPTYMLWLIDEGGNFAGVKMFDNFYGLQSVIDYSIVQSEDILGDTLVLRVSNLYSKLTSKFKDNFSTGERDDPNASDSAQGSAFADILQDTDRNLSSGMLDDYVVDIEGVRLKPGVRVHLRMGYSANPNALQTVFNGTITQVEAGDIVTITAQSDAIELSPIVNNANKSGDTGSTNEGLMGSLWLSEPRDMMVRLLSMGASVIKENLAHATSGTIFSENKFGIRHFGTILYEPLSDGEQKKHDDRAKIISEAVTELTTAKPGDVAGKLIETSGVDDIAKAAITTGTLGASDGVIGLFNSTAGGYLRGDNNPFASPAFKLMADMWSQFAVNRDYELFKRNIYPGNGLGIAQYLGGDIVDGGLIKARVGPSFVETALSKAEEKNLYEAGQDLAAGYVPQHYGVYNTGETETGDQDIARLQLESGANPADFTSVAGRKIKNPRQNHPFMKAMGLLPKDDDDDLPGLDEVSFRAQTYMKSVWDLFQLCAGLLPNYIVAVRPFEDRSTVFYGKPHWLYTSGVIPITTGIPKQATLKIEKQSKDLETLLKKASQIANPLADLEAELKFYADAKKANPYIGAGFSTAGTPEGAVVPRWVLEKYQTLPLTTTWEGKEIQIIPAKTGQAVTEMHLPTTANLHGAPSANDGHKQLPDLPPGQRYPYFFDRKGGWAGGQKIPGGAEDRITTGGTIGGEDPNLEGNPTAFTPYLSPEEEQWYINMRWFAWHHKPAHYPKAWINKKILVFNANNGRACVCTPGDYGPGITDSPNVAGVSPDTAHVLEITHGTPNIWFGLLDDDAKLGPVFDADTSGIPATTSSSGNTADRIDSANLPGADALDEDAISDWWNIETKKFSNSPALYETSYGHLDQNVTVFIDPNVNLYANNEQNIGYRARLFYDKEFHDQEKAPGGIIGAELGNTGRTLDQAEEIWKEFRRNFHGKDTGYKNPREIYKDNPRTIRMDLDDTFSAETDNLEVRFNLEDGSGWGEDDLEEFDEGYLADISEFYRFLWQDPWRRAWLVMVTDHTQDDNDLGGIPLPNRVNLPDVDLENPFDDEGFNYQWNFSQAARLWEIWLNLKYGDFQYTGITNSVTGKFDQHFVDAVVDWMENNSKEGNEAETLLDGVLEGAADAWDASIGRLVTAVGQGLTGLLNVYQSSMMMLGQGLNMAGAMQKHANMLNKVFNDSIYYAAGEPGSLARLADNPFTREYGEPVIEIREPLQRMHYINSFQHIINNGIIENLDGVATVVTASSDGKYPVSAYLDKGMPADRQTEITVETGLFWDNAKGSGVLGVIHPLLHPIETARGVTKLMTGSSDELLSKRVALYHLKESLKDIYSGEIVMLGNADIRPHDLIYISDLYERIYGMFEVEQVVHHFTPDQGFITSITPNAIVSINDPARWSMISWI